MERSDVRLLSGYTFRGVAVLFRSATLPQSTPTLLHISANECKQPLVAVVCQNFVLMYFMDDPLPSVVVVVVLGSSGGGEDLQAKVTLINKMT